MGVPRCADLGYMPPVRAPRGGTRWRGTFCRWLCGAGGVFCTDMGVLAAQGGCLSRAIISTLRWLHEVNVHMLRDGCLLFSPPNPLGLHPLQCATFQAAQRSCMALCTAPHRNVPYRTVP